MEEKQKSIASTLRDLDVGCSATFPMQKRTYISNLVYSILPIDKRKYSLRQDTERSLISVIRIA